MTASAMRVIRYILLFSLLYYALMTISGLIVVATGSHPSGVNVVGLIVAASCTAVLFIRKYRRTFSLGEYLTVVIGSVLVDIALELGFMAIMNGKLFTDKWPSMVLIFGGHALLLALAYSPWSWVVRNYSKKVAAT